jgi:ubiquinone/menaquinone biosynthesis C-methylase UbiE
MTAQARTADFAALTEAQRTTWSRGDFHEIARHNVVMAERLCPAVELRPCERVLDVACGTGTGALVAARRRRGLTTTTAFPRGHLSTDGLTAMSLL